MCQRHKKETTMPSRLLKPLPNPTKVWAKVSMDFVDALPKSHGKSTILVVIGRLTKYGHFIPISHPYTASQVPRVYFDNIFKLHGMLESIVCDRDPTFTKPFLVRVFFPLMELNSILVPPITHRHIGRWKSSIARWKYT